MQIKTQHYDVGVIIGRFHAPELHEAHKELIQAVQNQHDRVIVLLGLSPCKVTYNNPLDFEARKQMFSEQFPEVEVLYIKDCRGDESWSKNVDKIIGDLIGANQTVVLYGSRDSFIPFYFGRYDARELEQKRYMSASQIRKKIGIKAKKDKQFRTGVIWAVENEYPRVLACVDIAIIDQDRKRVLFARKPDENKLRFVGGFSDVKSLSFESDALREVREETGLEVYSPKYIGSAFIADWRYRNERDKIKTLFFKANYQFGSPKAADDIESVEWVNFEDLKTLKIMPEHQELLKMLIADIATSKEE